MRPHDYWRVAQQPNQGRYAYWLVMLEPLPGGGLMDACGLWHGYAAANDDAFTP